MDLTQVDQIIDSYKADGAWLVMILQDTQEAYNYLPEEALERVADRLSLGLGHVYNVATFYSSFSLTKRGRHVIHVCDGTACHIRGATSVLDEICRQLGIEDGQTTEDGAFTLESVACLGACALAPVMTVGSKYYGKLTPDKLKDILDAHRQEVSVNA
jgi:NADH-quinone oxidoreductase subunit E